jgi:hypothetical protein
MLSFAPPTPGPHHSDPARQTPTIAQIRRYILARRKRDQLASGLFADPAWDILLDLFVSSLEGRDVTVSGACIAAACPPTTGLRYLRLMTEAGLISRKDHVRDLRVKIIELTEEGQSVVQTFLTHL